MRRALIALAVLIAAAPAQAAPRPLTRLSEQAGFALAGDAALVSRPAGRSLGVFAYPLDGGAPRPVFSVQAPEGMQPDGRRIAASAQRAAITVTYGELSSDIEAVQAFGGPPGGPWTPLSALSGTHDASFVFPYLHQVD